MVKPDLKEHTIRKFKGINASRTGTSPEAFGPGEDELVDIQNFNVSANGGLEKRFGIIAHSVINTPITPVTLRVLGMQRTWGPGGIWIMVTDGNRLWRVSGGAGAATEITQVTGSTPVANLQWIVEYGGTASASAYQLTGVRWSAGLTGSAGGIISIPWNGQASDWNTNTPPGTHMTLFRNRAFIINSQGSTNTPGDETKVWFSEPTFLNNYGGAGLGNNIPLDFGDGDFFVASIPFNDQLIFFKTRKTYVMSTDGPPSSWQVRLMADNVGCVGRGTPKIIDGKLYFLSLKGVVRFDGSRAEVISENVKDLLDTYRDFKNPAAVMNTYASYWDNKYILWLPRQLEIAYGDNALVFDTITSTWTTWRLSNGVTSLGEAKGTDLNPDAQFFGSWNGNTLWKMSRSTVFTDNSLAFACSFTTKKQDFGSPSAFKRNYLIGLTVKDESADTGKYTVRTVTDDRTFDVSEEATAKLTVPNLKMKGGGYGRYFQSTVTQLSTAYAAVYDMSWVMEERGLIPKSTPNVVNPPTAIFTLGPDTNDQLDSDFVLK